MGPVDGSQLSAGTGSVPTRPRQFRAENPVYVGCCHVVPLLFEKYTPEVPTPNVNGHVTSLRLLHASRSISSFAPAATMFGAAGLIATAGSFCLFCGNGVPMFPTVTRASELNAPAPAATTSAA